MQPEENTSVNPPAAGAPRTWTPGPWVVHEGGNYMFVGGPGYLEYVDRESYLGGPFAIAEVNYKQTATHDEDREQAIANARLIAAAPELYSALAKMAEAGKRTPHGALMAAAMREARVVLAIARGENAVALPPEGGQTK